MGRDFVDAAVLLRPDGAEALALGPQRIGPAGEDFLRFLWSCVGGGVEVEGIDVGGITPTNQQVAHGAADQVETLPGSGEPLGEWCQLGENRREAFGDHPFRLDTTSGSPRAALPSFLVTNVADQPSWTIGVWPFDATTAMLTLQSAHRPDVTISRSLVEKWADATAASEFQRVRTSAVGPATAEALMNHGFVVRQELDFLVADLTNDVRHPVGNTSVGEASWRIGRVRAADAVRIDVAAFGDEWALDAAAFEQSCRATQYFHVRGARRGFPLPMRGGPFGGKALGFCLTGVSDDTSYLQRLAVAPTAQRRGAAGALIDDSMRWAVGRGARRMFVNTDINNVAALSLYRQWGFESVGYHLRVMECDRATLVGHPK